MGTRRRPVAIAIAMLAVLAAGCGAGSAASGTAASTVPSGNPLAGLSAKQILNQAIADFKASSSVHIAGSEGDTGQTFSLDLTIGVRGCTGTEGLGAEGTMRLLRIGSTIWIKPDNEFWKSALAGTPANLSAVQGKYIRLSPKGPAASSYGGLCYLSQFVSQLTSGTGQVVKGQTAVIDGQPALQLKDPSQAGSTYVTISARPQFLRTGGSEGHVDFTGYNAPLALTAPPASQTVAGSRYGL